MPHIFCKKKVGSVTCFHFESGTLKSYCRYLMVRLQPGVLDINTDDVGFAGKLLEEEFHGIGQGNGTGSRHFGS